MRYLLLTLTCFTLSYIVWKLASDMNDPFIVTFLGGAVVSTLAMFILQDDE